jgi:uncharacterized membrane protein YphA (DoxX/SURF4 family)
MWACAVVAFAAGASLLLGFFSPIAATLVAGGDAGVALSWLPSPSPNLLDSSLATILVAVIAVVVVLVGPGAYSLDSHRFGRREIVIPPLARPPEQAPKE